jgi:hypothetical protein
MRTALRLLPWLLAVVGFGWGYLERQVGQHACNAVVENARERCTTDCKSLDRGQDGCGFRCLRYWQQDLAACIELPDSLRRTPSTLFR